MMDRRAFLSALSGSLLAAPLAAVAQQAGKVYRIGTINDTDPATPKGQGPFYDRMRELGWVYGQNFVVERRAYGVQPERIPDLATELVQWGVDVFIVGAPSEAIRVKRVTPTIPIIVSDAALLVVPALAASLAKPGGNVTGIQTLGPEVAGKLVAVLKETIPGLSRSGMLTSTAKGASYQAHIQETERSGKALGVRLQPVPVYSVQELEAAFAAFRAERAQGVIVWRTPFTYVHMKAIADLAMKFRFPTISDFPFFTREGGLLSYGYDRLEVLRWLAEMTDLILRGTQVGEIPIRQVTTFQLKVNLKTATALGLTIPPSLLQRADQVIE
jgi:putative ABC transport system substrate-binding protein